MSQPQQPGYPAAYTPGLHQQMGNSAPLYDQRAAIPQARAAVPNAYGNATPQGNAYVPPRPVEVYTLQDHTINEAIPEPVRQQFQTDEAGRPLFFTAPPLERPHKGLAPEFARLGHSLSYLRDKKGWIERRRKLIRDRQARRVLEELKQLQREAAHDEEQRQELKDIANDFMGNWLAAYQHQTDKWMHESGLYEWQAMMKEVRAEREAKKAEEEARAKAEVRARTESAAKESVEGENINGA